MPEVVPTQQPEYWTETETSAKVHPWPAIPSKSLGENTHAGRLPTSSPASWPEPQRLQASSPVVWPDKATRDASSPATWPNPQHSTVPRWEATQATATPIKSENATQARPVQWPSSSRPSLKSEGWAAKFTSESRATKWAEHEKPPTSKVSPWAKPANLEELLSTWNHRELSTKGPEHYPRMSGTDHVATYNPFGY